MVRVSNNMISGQVVFNMQRSLATFLHLETQLSSGKRINRASDDPVGTLRDLDYRAELARLEQYRTNVQEANNWQESYDSILADLKDIVTSAKEVAISMANPQPDDTGLVREAEASEIQSLYERIIALGNTQVGSKSVLAGYRTNAPALARTSNGARYLGDAGQIDFQIESGSRLGVNLLGSEVFFSQLGVIGAEADLNVGLTGSTLLSDLHRGDGIDLSGGATPGTFTITDRNLNLTSTIDLVTAGATTVQDVIDAINTQLAADGISDVTAQIGPAGNGLMLATSPSGLITVDTSLSVLRNRQGVDVSPGTINLSDGSGLDFDVDLSSSADIGDIIANFNSAMAAGTDPRLANVTMQINGAGNGLEIVDGNAVPIGLTISESSSVDSTAADLGILGDVGSLLIGEALDPAVSIEVADTTGTTALDLGIAGSFFNDFAGADLDPGLTLTSRLSDLNNLTGMQTGRLMIWQGERQGVIDTGDPTLVTVQDLILAIQSTGLDITTSINASGTGIQVANNDTTRSFTIEDGENSHAAKALGLFGASDMVGTVKLLENSLRNDDGEGIQLLLGLFDAAIENLLSARATVGAKALRLQSTDARLQQLNLTFTERLSLVEDADIAKLVSDLAVYENNYQAALAATAKIIQPTLLNFLE